MTPCSRARMAVWATVLAIAALLPGCARAGGEPFQPTQTTTVLLSADEPVGQTVNPAGDAITGIDLQVATYAAPPDPRGRLTVALVDPRTGADLARTTLPGEDLADLAWVTARFDPPVEVPDVVLVEATWAGETDVALLANAPDGQRTRSGGLVPDPYAGGELVGPAVAPGGDLAFRVRGVGGVGAAAGQVREVIASAGSRLADQPAFAVLWSLALAGAAALAVVGFRRARLQDTGPAGPPEL